MTLFVFCQLVAEPDELIGAHGDGGVGLALVAAEFYFKDSGFEDLGHSADLATKEAVGGGRLEERDDRELRNVSHLMPQSILVHLRLSVFICEPMFLPPRPA